LISGDRPEALGARLQSANAAGSEAGLCRRRLALVVWEAEIGGAETLMLALAQRFRLLGAEASFVIVGPEGPLIERLHAAHTSYVTLGYRRGRSIVGHPRRLAQAVAGSGADGALLVECGYLGACLRLGGYRGPIVAVEHGAILFPSATRPGRLWDRINRATGAWAADAEVGVSDLVLARMRREPHPDRLRRIYNGIDPAVFTPTQPHPSGDSAEHVTLGFVGRLAAGKGLHVLVRAIAQAVQEVPVRLLVAGDGPEHEELVALAGDLGVGDRVAFLGLVHDVQAFWQRCQVAIVPSNHFIESFCLAAVEAAACGKPIIATRNGALPEVVRDGTTGTLVAPGDVGALAGMIVHYATSPTLREAHGAAGRIWASEQFGIDQCAGAYIDLFAELGAGRR
jgi:glycosyltransferase involved in cell wall biosynthesis